MVVARKLESRGSVDRHHEHEQVPGAREQPGGDEDARINSGSRSSSSALPGFASRWARGVCVNARAAQRRGSASAAAAERRAGGTSGAKPTVSIAMPAVDRAEEVRDREAEREPAEVVLALRHARSPWPTGVLHGDVEEHESSCPRPRPPRTARRCWEHAPESATPRATEEERRGHQRDRARPHAIDQPPAARRQQHRERGEERHQHAHDQGRGARARAP